MFKNARGNSSTEAGFSGDKVVLNKYKSVRVVGSLYIGVYSREVCELGGRGAAADQYCVTAQYLQPPNQRIGYARSGSVT